MGKQYLGHRVRAWLKKHMRERLGADMHIYLPHAMLDNSQHVVSVCRTTIVHLFSISI